MPSAHAAVPAWRERRAALSKKRHLEAELLLESEIVVIGKSVAPIQVPASPVSVASMFDAMPEIKPITLPDAWTVVGKGGRPLRNEKMYDEPKPEPQKAKKKRKKQMSKKCGSDSAGEDDAEPALAMLDAELPSSSMQALGRQLRHSKLVTHGREAKAWAKYRQAKELRALARDMLVAALAEDDAECAPDETMIGSDASSKHKAVIKVACSNKTNSKTDKARRKARDAAAAARCYWPEAEDVHFPEHAQPSVGQRVTNKYREEVKMQHEEIKVQLRSEKEPCAGSSNAKIDPGPYDSGEFTLVEEEEVSSPRKPASLGKAAGRAKGKQCSVM